MILRKLRNLFFSIVALLLILLATVSALVETETGSHWVVNRLAGMADVTLGPMGGNLRTGLDIASINYQQGELVLHAEQVAFRWRPIDLFYSALMIDSLRASQISLKLPVAAEEPTDDTPFSAWPSLRLPIRIQVRHLELRDIRYQQGEQQLAWEKLSGDLSLGTFNLRYRDLSLIHSDYSLRLSGRTGLDYPYPSEAELQWQWQPAADDGSEGLLYRGQSRLTGSLLQLQLDNTLDSPVQATAKASGPLVNENRELNLAPSLALTLEWPSQTLPEAWWIAGKTAPVTRGVLKAEGNWQHYRATLDGAVQLPEAPALALDTQVTGNLDGVEIQYLNIRELGDRLQAVNASAASSSAEQAAVAGGNVDNSVNTDARVAIHGSVHWIPELEWQLAVETTAFNLAGIIDNWPSHLNARFTTSGNLQASQLHAALRDLHIDGVLRGVNVLGSGSVVLEGNTLRSDALELIVGANKVQLKGVLGDDIDLNWNINAPLLQQLDESLSGSVVSKGELRGDRTRPRISISASVNEFRWGDNGVEKLDLSLSPLAPQTELVGPVLEPDPAASSTAPSTAPTETESASPLPAAINLLTGELLQEDYQLNFVANKLHLAEQYFSSITLKGSGSVAKHQLQAIVRSPSLGRADIGVQGEYGDYAWQGTLNQLAVKLTKVPRWWLTASKPIRVSGTGVVLGEQCLTTRSNLTAAVERDSLVEREQLRGEWQPNQSPVIGNRYDWLVSTP